MATIIIAGGTGFLGKVLEAYFLNRNDQVHILTRNPTAHNHIYWDGKSPGDWVDKLEAADILINLSGKSVDCRYNAKNKSLIFHSRIDSTMALHKAIATLDNPPKIWLNASSATIYAHSEEQLMTESNGIIENDFSVSICKDWESAFYSMDLPHTRQVALRTSIVLGNGGGAIPKLRPIVKMGLGGYQGSGAQKVSWIHELDFCRAVAFLIEREDLKGSFNITAPIPSNNKSFMQHIRKAMGVSVGINQPAFLLKIGAFFMRTEAELLLKSRFVYPERLREEGFEFQFERIEDAIHDLIGQTEPANKVTTKS